MVHSGIQHYLFENGRIDNIFADIYYERFNDALHELLSTYEVRLNTQGNVHYHAFNVTVCFVLKSVVLMFDWRYSSSIYIYSC
jgi:hypothetical protein